MGIKDLPNGNSSNRKNKIVSLGLAGLLIVAASVLSMQYVNNENSNANNVSAAGPAANNDIQSEGDSVNSSRKEITLIAQDAEVEIAPGKVVKMWTFNGTVPAPPLRFAEGENVTIKFINKTPIPHTIHFHGNHDDVNDGVYPQIMPNDTYLYNITAAPAGTLMYHCHAHPTSLHIRMGMYGALIVDPKDNPLPPAREYVMVMSEYDTKEIMKFETEYYPINGYADQYLKNPLQVNHGELVRLYVINIGTTIPYQFHLHSTTFKAYPSGLLSNEPIEAQTIPVGPGDATIIEAKWKYPGTYLFHSHGIQEERGNMGEIVVGSDNGQATVANQSISMFDWQYELQKNLQKPKVINYTEEQLNVSKGQQLQNGSITHDNTTTFIDPTANATDTKVPHEEGQQHANRSSTATEQQVSIVQGAISPSSEIFYDPPSADIKKGSAVTWINNDSAPHTATSGSPDGEAPGEAFDTGIIGPGKRSGQLTIDADPGTYDYYCTLHPYMKGQLTVSE
jgi:nitrite reductase (NO-forming)